MAERQAALSAGLATLFSALLVALAASSSGAPSVVTAVTLAATFALAATGRTLVTRGRDRHVALRRVAAPLLLALAAAAYALLAVDERRFQPSWWLLVGLPLAIGIAQEQVHVVPRTPALTALLFAALALGLLSAEPWESLSGRALLCALAVVGVVAAAHESTRRLLPHGAPAPSRASWRRALATWIVIALLALLCGAGLDLALGPLPRRWRDPPPPEPQSDPIKNRLPPSSSSGDATLALVRWLGGATAPPARLLLRERVLEEVVDSELLYLAPKSGTASWQRDDGDGRADRRLVAPERALALPDVEGAEFQVTLLTAASRVLLRVDGPLWIEGESAALAADLSIERPTAQGAAHSYRVGALLPEQALAAKGAWRAANDFERRTLPEKFAGRPTLEALVAALPPAPDDARARVEAIVALLRESGRVDRAEPFRGWTDFATRRTGAPLHFAQCAALLARLTRIPARVVAGFATDRWLPAEQSFEVRALDEHYWIEAAFEEQGWVAFDPTPLLPGERDDAAVGEAQEQRDRVDKKSLQETFARQRPLIVGLLLLLLLAAWFAFPNVRVRIGALLRGRGPDGVAPAARRAWRFWQELIDRCRTFGLGPQPSWTATEFASALAATLPSLASALSDLLRLYHAGRFGELPLAPAEEARVRALLDEALPAALSEWRRERGAPAPAALDRNRR
ncbi:MAG: transglutaminase domain-containing protein [Planctomycetes bacterium]|nr:transglutaminase domain-containing protein [Planctomycetota bacterium]